MTAKDDFLGIVDKVLIDVEDVKGGFPGTIAKKKNDTAAGVSAFKFRPLTEEEKQEFVNSLDAKGKQLLSELEPKPNSHALRPRAVSEGP